MKEFKSYSFALNKAKSEKKTWSTKTTADQETEKKPLFDTHDDQPYKNDFNKGF